MEHQFKSGASSYTIHCTRGKVAGKDKNLETRVYGSGGGGSIQNGSGYTSPVYIGSTTVVHDKIYLELPNGKQEVIELTNWDVACMQGHDIMVLWVERNSKTKSSYLALKNFTTDKVVANHNAIKRIADQHYLLFGERNVISGIGKKFMVVVSVLASLLLFRMGGFTLFLLALAAVLAYELFTRFQSTKTAKEITQEIGRYLQVQEEYPAVQHATGNKAVGPA